MNNGVRMDDLLTSAWLSGQTDTFDQILHEIMSENVSGLLQIDCIPHYN